MIELTACGDGVYLPVRAQPGSRRSQLRGEHRGALHVAVSQAAEKGKANKAIHVLLVKQLGLRGSQLMLVSGETSKQKRFLVREIDVDQLRGRIDQALQRS